MKSEQFTLKLKGREADLTKHRTYRRAKNQKSECAIETCYNWTYFRVVSTFDLPPLQGESLPGGRLPGLKKTLGWNGAKIRRFCGRFLPQRGWRTQPRVSTLGTATQICDYALKRRQIFQRTTQRESRIELLHVSICAFNFVRAAMGARFILSAFTPSAFRANSFILSFPGLKPRA